MRVVRACGGKRVQGDGGGSRGQKDFIIGAIGRELCVDPGLLWWGRWMWR